MSETVEIPKALANEIREMPWFQLYETLEDYVLEAVRKHTEKMDECVGCQARST